MQYYERLKQVREDKEKTQKEIAEYLKTTRQQIGKYENGLFSVLVSVLNLVCLFLCLKYLKNLQ